MKLPDYLDHLSVVLCHTSHPGNIGSAARAMKTMGLTHLILVAPNLMATPMTPEPPSFHPKKPKEFTLPEEAFALASGAGDILEKAEVYATLKEALAPMRLAFATTARRRELTSSVTTPRAAAGEIIAALKEKDRVALVFGSEKFGLTIPEVALCNRLISIPGNPDYFSLNLAQAVQVLSYEILSHSEEITQDSGQRIELATRGEVQGLLAHLETTMDALGFFHKRNKARLVRRLGRFLDKAAPEREEIDIWRGFLSLVDKKMNHKDQE